MNDNLNREPSGGKDAAAGLTLGCVLFIVMFGVGAVGIYALVRFIKWAWGS